MYECMHSKKFVYCDVAQAREHCIYLLECGIQYVCTYINKQTDDMIMIELELQDITSGKTTKRKNKMNVQMYNDSNC